MHILVFCLKVGYFDFVKNICVILLLDQLFSSIRHTLALKKSYILSEPILGPNLVMHILVFCLKVGYFDFVKNILKTLSSYFHVFFSWIFHFVFFRGFVFFLEGG